MVFFCFLSFFISSFHSFRSAIYSDNWALPAGPASKSSGISGSSGSGPKDGGDVVKTLERPSSNSEAT